MGYNPQTVIIMYVETTNYNFRSLFGVALANLKIGTSSISRSSIITIHRDYHLSLDRHPKATLMLKERASLWITHTQSRTKF